METVDGHPLQVCAVAIFILRPGDDSKGPPRQCGGLVHRSHVSNSAILSRSVGLVSRKHRLAAFYAHLLPLQVL
jgi:hypothetical protein